MEDDEFPRRARRRHLLLQPVVLSGANRVSTRLLGIGVDEEPVDVALRDFVVALVARELEVVEVFGCARAVCIFVIADRRPKSIAARRAGAE
jgi:hypothetical protein